jgi:hypothetical protein
MLTYPLLTLLEQVDLPSLTATPTALLSQFEDSTHQVFLCDTAGGRMVLKVCDEAAVAQSGFWQGVNHLFGADFPKCLARIQLTHDLLTEQGLYAVPDFVASNCSAFEHGFVLTRFIDGVDIDATQVPDAMVVQLAKHIARLHQQTKPTWGDCHAPMYQAAEWGERLQATLSTLAEKSNVAIPEPLLQDVLTQASRIQETMFVPVMLDLRWDQFRKVGNAQADALALIDLDAFVMAPCSLDLVLLAYILTPQQFALFKATYKAMHDWPDYSAQKPCYQLLLFLMQVLGETDLAQWMKR